MQGVRRTFFQTVAEENSVMLIYFFDITTEEEKKTQREREREIRIMKAYEREGY